MRGQEWRGGTGRDDRRGREGGQEEQRGRVGAGREGGSTERRCVATVPAHRAAQKPLGVSMLCMPSGDMEATI